ncbi:squalene epoxidase-domain-containing protein [Aspergillus pseudoustus]|uniref:squalene monooxygenase n=1 Tax=Aspergillus pseudoustus TaxID=1810923 RepID=A0ABR4J7G5_9EURO
MAPGPASGTPAVPSRNALRVLRKLALTGSTVGSFCTVAAITYDVHRRVSVAERIVENKRALQTSAPRYDATSAARRLSRMMEAAEAGEFRGLEAWKEEERKSRRSQRSPAEYGTEGPLDQPPFAPPVERPGSPFTSEHTFENSLPIETTELVREPGLSQSIRKPTALKELHPPSPPLPADTRAKYDIVQSNARTWDTFIEDDIDSPPKKQESVEELLQDLLDRHLYIDAAQVFLDSHPATRRGISRDRRELAVQAFYLNCKENNVFIARSIFERLEEVDHVSSGMWKILMVALAKNGCVESAATLYMRFRGKITVPPALVELVLRCLLESHRLSSAKWFLMRNLAVDRDCGLCGIYLSGLWKKTRSIELINGQFTRLLMMTRRMNKPVTEKLFNPVVKAYVEFGRAADAEALVQQMTANYGVQLSCRTKGILVFSKALGCDWIAVDNGLQEMHQLGMTAMKSEFVGIFDRIFLEYWVSHTAIEIREFLYRYIDRFDIIPDKVLYKHILEAVVEKGDEAMLAEFLDMAKQRGWKVNVNGEEFLDILRARRLELEDSPIGFWQMLHAARADHSRAAASRQLLGYDQRSFPMETVNAMPRSKAPMAWYTRTLQQLTPAKPVDQYQKVNKQMTHFMHAGKMSDALVCFRNAKSAGFEFKVQHIELAAIATVLEHGVDAARILIRTEWGTEREGLPIFFRQIEAIDPSAEVEIIKTAIFRFYKICWSSKQFLVKHHITASTAHRLIAANQPEMALDVLVAVYTSRYGRRLGFDGVCMKIFLRAFAAVNDLAGVRWCILTALARGSAANRELIVEVHRVLGVLRREAQSEGLSPERTKKIMNKLKFLGSAADRLEKKYNGDPEFAKLHGNPGLKKHMRYSQQKPLNRQAIWKQQSTLWTVIERWDEEYELEKVLGRIDNDEQSILARWNEENCLTLENPNDQLTLRLEYAPVPPVNFADSANSLNFSSAAATMATTASNGHTNGLPSKTPAAAELRRRVHHDADIVIVGAGVLGCALAVALGNQGRSVLLLEASLKEPDRIVGELLQPGGVAALEKLGIRDCLDGIDAIPTEGYYVTYSGQPVAIPYPVQSPGAPPPEGRSFHHGRFVMKLREAARACPNVTIVETKVTDLVTCSHTKQVLGVECVTKEAKDCYFGQLTVVADGYASKFRKQYHPYTPKVKSKFWGLELIDAELPQPHYGHVLLNPGSPPILIYQIGTHETRILCDIPENLSSASVKNGGVKGHLRNTVLPSLPKCVQPSFAAALDKGQLRSMPNSFLPGATNKTPGLLIAGDALNMRHPLTGGGMTIALNDVVLLRDLLSPKNVPNLSNTTLVLKQLSTFHWRRKMGASVINILAQALYSLFAADDDNLKALQRGCFEYFSIGMHRQPVSMLGGMLKKPQVLFAHFFTVAFLSLWMLIRDSPLYMLPVTLIRCTLVFWTACVVIFPYMVIEAFC